MTKNILFTLLLALNLISCKNTEKNEPKSQNNEITIDEIISDSAIDLNGKKMMMIFNNSKDIVTIELNGEKIELVSKRPASGIWYANNNYELSGKRKQVELKKDGKIIFKSQEKSSKKNGELILMENTFGNLKLEKGIPLEELKIKELFNNLTVSKNIGEQDGPNYFYYKIGTEAILTTPNTENETLSQLWINKKSKVLDEYGIKLGMEYSDIEKRRPNMNISTEHFHIYLYKDGSNIAYEMSIGNYNGPDKEEYSIEDIKNYSSKVVSIIWK